MFPQLLAETGAVHVRGYKGYPQVAMRVVVSLHLHNLHLPKFTAT